MDKVITSGSLDGVIVSSLVRNERDIGSIPAQGAIFPIFITPTTLVAVTCFMYKFHTAWLLTLLCVCICKRIVNDYVTVSIK